MCIVWTPNSEILAQVLCWRMCIIHLSNIHFIDFLSSWFQWITGGNTEANQYNQAEDGKTELSLMHFTVSSTQNHQINSFSPIGKKWCCYEHGTFEYYQYRFRRKNIEFYLKVVWHICKCSRAQLHEMVSARTVLKSGHFLLSAKRT